MRKDHLLPILGALAAVLAVSSDAAASVSNPDYYFIDVPSGQDSIYLGPSAQFSLMAGQLEGDIDSSGNWAFNAASFQQNTVSGLTIGGSAVSAQFLVGASGTSGRFLYNAAHDVELTLRGRVVLTGGGLVGTCQTALFTVVLSSAKTFTTGGGSLAGSAYNTTTGSFRAVASDFTVTAISSGCNSAADRSTINSALGFGTGYSPGMKFDNGTVNSPQVLQP